MQAFAPRRVRAPAILRLSRGGQESAHRVSNNIRHMPVRKVHRRLPTRRTHQCVNEPSGRLYTLLGRASAKSPICVSALKSTVTPRPWRSFGYSLPLLDFADALRCCRLIEEYAVPRRRSRARRAGDRGNTETAPDDHLPTLATGSAQKPRLWRPHRFQPFEPESIFRTGERQPLHRRRGRLDLRERAGPARAVARSKNLGRHRELDQRPGRHGDRQPDRCEPLPGVRSTPGPRSCSAFPPGWKAR